MADRGSTTKERHGKDFHMKAGLKGAEAYKKRQKMGVAKPRGFAAMSKAQLKEASSRGGKNSKRGKAE